MLVLVLSIPILRPVYASPDMTMDALMLESQSQNATLTNLEKDQNSIHPNLWMDTMMDSMHVLAKAGEEVLLELEGILKITQLSEQAVRY